MPKLRRAPLGLPRQLGGGAAAVEEISIMAKGVHLAFLGKMSSPHRMRRMAGSKS